MKKLLLLLALPLLMIGCGKINDDNNPDNRKEVTARYSFVVSDGDTKAVIISQKPLEFECEAGDKIEIEVAVYDESERMKYTGVIPADCGTVFKSSCNLVYDGTSWNLDKDGKKASVIEVTAKEGFVVDIKYDFINEPPGDYDNWFWLGRRKILPLTAGDQTIVLDFSDAEEMAK